MLREIELVFNLNRYCLGKKKQIIWKSRKLLRGRKAMSSALSSAWCIRKRRYRWRRRNPRGGIKLVYAGGINRVKNSASSRGALS